MDTLLSHEAKSLSRKVRSLTGAPPYLQRLQAAQTTPRLHLIPKTEKCCLRRMRFKVGRHQGTSESKVIFTSGLMRYPHLIDFWRQYRLVMESSDHLTDLWVSFNKMNKSFFPSHFVHQYKTTPNKIINATLLFLPPFFMSWTQRSKTFSIFQKAYFSQILFTNLSKSVLVSTSPLQR